MLSSFLFVILKTGCKFTKKDKKAQAIAMTY